MERVAVVGAGLIGRAWSLAFARGGCAVALHDPAEGAAEATRAGLPGVLEDLAREGLLEGEAPAEVAARVSVAPSLAAALDGAAHVQENAPERIEVKRALFAELDRRAAPEAVLASSSSHILPSAFSEDLPGRARCLVAHPINPPYLVPAVEIVPAPWTDRAAVERTAALMARIGQSPIAMAREIDGFVMNRLQGALLDEAFRLVAEGYASAEDVDRGIRDGLGLRWAFMGPFETIDLNAPKGVRDYVARYDGMYGTLAAGARTRVDWSGEVLDRIEADRRGRLPEDGLAGRQTWRDRRLMALIRWKREQGVE